MLLNGTADLQVSAKRNMTPLYRALRKANRTAVSYKLDGVNHLFQPEPAQWPMINGAQQPVFSPEALKLIYAWVANETRLPGGPVPLTVKRSGPAKSAKPSRTPATARASM